MSSVGRVTEITAKSESSFDDAIRVGIERATQTLRNVTSAWVKEQEVEIEPGSGSIKSYKVNLLVTFVLE
jgi:dodecin